MIEEPFINIIQEIGFPVAVAVILLWDKLKSNGSLKAVVQTNNKLLESNNHILHKLSDRLDC